LANVCLWAARVGRSYTVTSGPTATATSEVNGGNGATVLGGTVGAVVRSVVRVGAPVVVVDAPAAGRAAWWVLPPQAATATIESRRKAGLTVRRVMVRRA
jgi:hypothetical protein